MFISCVLVIFEGEKEEEKKKRLFGDVNVSIQKQTSGLDGVFSTWEPRCVFFFLPPGKSFCRFLFFPGVRVALWLCNVCVCVVPRLYRGGTSRIDLPWVRNEWPRSDGRNVFCLFILKTGEILFLCKVCARSKKKGKKIERDKKEKKKPVATQSNSIGTPSSYSFLFFLLLLLPPNSLLALVKVFPKQRIYFIESRERSFKDRRMHPSDCHLLNNYTISA